MRFKAVGKARVASAHRLSEKVCFYSSRGTNCQIIGCARTTMCKELTKSCAKTPASSFASTRGSAWGAASVQMAGGGPRRRSSLASPADAGVYGSRTLRLLAMEVLAPPPPRAQKHGGVPSGGGGGARSHLTLFLPLLDPL